MGEGPQEPSAAPAAYKILMADRKSLPWGDFGSLLPLGAAFGDTCGRICPRNDERGARRTPAPPLRRPGARS